uniref:Uncharacterized protein n=1 Tax=Anguilla anguilla TaxID=7936 RepID=A0A0E9PM41_ANGAN
MSFSPLQWLLM